MTLLLEYGTEDLEVQMNHKNIKKIIIIFIILVLLTAIGYMCITDDSENSVKTEPIEIEEVKPNTYGTITVYDPYDNEVFQYVGDIDIQNDGKDGNQIYIYVDLEDAGWLY